MTFDKNKNFTQKFQELALKRSPFCLGIDPTEETIKSWGLEFSPNGLKKMCEIILEAAQDKLALVKPQSAYFERFGPEGLMILKDMTHRFQQNNTLVLLDAKRGDIDSTSLSYAKAYLGEDSIYKFDALTATTYMGFEALKPMFEYAIKNRTAIFIVVRSSNQEGKIIQDAIINNNSNSNITIADYVAKKINEFNQEHVLPGTELLAAVMGATLKNKEIKSTLSNLGNCLILTPGIGHQGATINDLLINYSGYTKQIIPTSSRAILSHGPDIKKLQEAIKSACDQASKLMD